MNTYAIAAGDQITFSAGHHIFTGTVMARLGNLPPDWDSNPVASEHVHIPTRKMLRRPLFDSAGHCVVRTGDATRGRVVFVHRREIAMHVPAEQLAAASMTMRPVRVAVTA